MLTLFYGWHTTTVYTEAEFMNVHNLESPHVSVYNVYISNQFQTTFAQGGGD
jgi:hypothetical protein